MASLRILYLTAFYTANYAGLNEPWMGGTYFAFSLKSWRKI